MKFCRVLRVLLVTLLSAIILTGCNGNTDMSEGHEFRLESDNTEVSGAKSDVNSIDSYDSEGVVNSDEIETNEYTSNSNESTDESSISTDKIIYNGEVSVVVQDYEKAKKKLYDLVDEYKCIIQDEQETNNNTDYTMNSKYDYYNYTVILRVKSDKYKEFLEKSEEIGKIKDKHSYTENMSKRYYANEKELKILEAKEKRLINKLATTSDDNLAVSIDSQLTQIQIQIARLKTEQAEIDMDVEYSTLTIRLISQVLADIEIESSESYIERFGTTVKNAYKETWVLLGALLIFIIARLPYLTIIGVILFFIIKKRKKNKTKRLNRNITEPIKESDNINKTLAEEEVIKHIEPDTDKNTK